MPKQTFQQIDILIIGADPAGAAAAWHARQAGLSVTILERDARATARTCLGWLGPSGIAEVEALQLRAANVGAAQFRGVRLWSWDLQRSVTAEDAELAGWIVERATFDAALRGAAERAGAALHTNAVVAQIFLNESSVAARTVQGQDFAARLLLIADGAESAIARQAGFKTTSQTNSAARASFLARPLAHRDCGVDVVLGPAQQAALVTLVRGAGSLRAAYVRRQADVGAPILASAAAAVVVQLDEEAKKSAPAKPTRPKSKTNAESLKTRNETAPNRAHADCLIPAGVALEMDGHVAKRTLLIGDAGGFVAAFSNEGIYPALRSGRLAAQTAARALRATQCQDDLASFDALWRADLADYLRVPNTDLSLLTPLVFSNAQMARRVARAFLLGHKL